MISASLKSKFNDAKTMNAVTLKVRTELQIGKLIKVLATKLLAELRRMAPYADYSAVADLTVEDLLHYLETLVWMRVEKCTEEYSNGFKQYLKIQRNVAVPVLMYQVLISIGRAYDKEFNLEFMPAFSVDQDHILSVDEMAAISDLFRMFENSGLKVVYGIPNDPEGELEFMAMTVIEGEIRSYRRNHPVYGFLAAFVASRSLSEITGMMSRIIYGYEDDYEYQVSALMDAING